MSRGILGCALLAATLALEAAPTAAQPPQREYKPSAVAGTPWNEPGNANPFIPGYFADPTIRKFGDIYYLYATTDGTGNGYGPAQVWVSYDFVNWKNIVMNWPTTEVVWAPDVVQQPDGSFRYYYCEPCNINIGESASPIGPWHNILGKDDAVMVPDRYVHNVITLDPQLFRDDDGQEYLYFTTWGIYKGFGCGVARLREPQAWQSARLRRSARHWREDAPYAIAADTFFAEKRLIPNTELKDIFEAPFVFKRGDIYYFTYSSGSCHNDTYRVQYATSTTGPMGPFTYRGELLTTNEDLTVHGPGHHSILEMDGRYYIVYHRHNLPRSVHGFNRQVCIDELKFDQQGSILPVTPTHSGPSLFPPSRAANLASGAKVTASSYYSDWFRPEYAVDDNNATLWKAARSVWDCEDASSHTDWSHAPNPEWLQIDLGRVEAFSEVWTQFEYATFFYQYLIETSTDGQSWTLYADRTANTMQGSPMIDRGKAKARYLRITITDTQKNGHMPAIWNVKVWKKAPRLPYSDGTLQAATDAQAGAGYPGMHLKDVSAADRRATTAAALRLSIAQAAEGRTAPFDVSEITAEAGDGSSWLFKANKPLRARVKDGHWALFFNGTQSLTSERTLPQVYRYNAPYTISALVLQTKAGPVSTLLSMGSSRADLGTTQLRLGTDPQTGMVSHNGSFESYGAASQVRSSQGAWHHWVLTFDGWMERVYLDGRLLHEQNNFIMVRPDGHITIGADATGTNNFMGYVADISVTPTSLSAEGVEAICQMLNREKATSLGDDDFEETDPDSQFKLSPTAKAVFEKREPFTLAATTSLFNSEPLQHGGYIYKEVEGDFVAMVRLDDMEGLDSHSVKSYNEGGLLIADDSDTFYQLGVFPLYNCGNMLTLLSPQGRPQYPNYKGYEADRYLQFERRGDKLFARTSPDGTEWTNMPGSPVSVGSPRLRVGCYQTTYSEQPSWVRLRDMVVYQ